MKETLVQDIWTEGETPSCSPHGGFKLIYSYVIMCPKSLQHYTFFLINLVIAVTLEMQSVGIE